MKGVSRMLMDMDSRRNNGIEIPSWATCHASCRKCLKLELGGSLGVVVRVLSDGGVLHVGRGGGAEWGDQVGEEARCGPRPRMVKMMLAAESSGEKVAKRSSVSDKIS